MYRVDYDGEQDRFLSRMEAGEREMISLLLQAMEDGQVTRCTLQHEWEICPTCHGEGGHSRRLGVISSEDWSEWDDEERHFYMSGGYDATCDRCGGSGKVRVLALESLPADVQEWVEGYEADLYEGEMISYMERLAGC